MTLAGQVSTTAGAGSTVKVALHDLGESQSEVTVKVTVVDPPQWFGAAPAEVAIVPLQPPVKNTEFFQLLNLVSMADCDWQAGSVWLVGQVIATGGAGSTVNVALHVFGPSQSEVTVKVTVVVPPQWFGAVPPELVSTPLQPPVKEAVVFQVANLLSIADCV